MRKLRAGKVPAIFWAAGPLAAVLTACVAAPQSQAPSSRPEGTAEPFAASTAPPQPTAGDFAGVVGSYAQSWRDRADVACTGDLPPDGGAAATCRIRSQIATINAQNALRDLNRLGNPPEEIVPVLEQTVMALEELAATDVVQSCADTVAAGCAGAVAKVTESVGQLVDLLPGWDAHLPAEVTGS